MAGHITARCTNPACTKTKSVPANYAGRIVRCPQCGIAFRIGESASWPVPGSIEATPNEATPESAANWWAPPAETTPAAPDPLPQEPIVGGVLLREGEAPAEPLPQARQEPRPPEVGLQPSVHRWKSPRVAIPLAVLAAISVVAMIVFLLPPRPNSPPVADAGSKRDDPNHSSEQVPPPKDSETKPKPRPLPGQILRETSLSLIEQGDEAWNNKSYDDAIQAYAAAEFLLLPEDDLGYDVWARILLVEVERDAHELTVAATRKQSGRQAQDLPRQSRRG